MSPARWFFVPLYVISHTVGFVFALVPALMFLNYATKRQESQRLHQQKIAMILAQLSSPNPPSWPGNAGEISRKLGRGISLTPWAAWYERMKELSPDESFLSDLKEKLPPPPAPALVDPTPEVANRRSLPPPYP